MGGAATGTALISVPVRLTSHRLVFYKVSYIFTTWNATRYNRRSRAMVMPSSRDLCVDTEFLPVSLPGRASRRTSAEASRLRYVLKRTQFPSNCASDRLLPLTSPKAGLGVTLHYAAHHLLAASAAGAVYTLHAQSLLIWSTQQLCGRHRSLQCYFRPLTHCQPPSKSVPCTYTTTQP
jgi:hypothetical protein